MAKRRNKTQARGHARAGVPAGASAGVPTVDRIGAFEDFRARAHASGRQMGFKDIEPYVLGPERGFDPPVVVDYPTDLVALDAYEQAARSQNVLKMLEILLGEDRLRVYAAFDRFPDKLNLLLGMALAIQDHFLGVGSSDVPGGTGAS